MDWYDNAVMSDGEIPVLTVDDLKEKLRICRRIYLEVDIAPHAQLSIEVDPDEILAKLEAMAPELSRPDAPFAIWNPDQGGHLYLGNVAAGCYRTTT
jgi:hypothetical protein